MDARVQVCTDSAGAHEVSSKLLGRKHSLYTCGSCRLSTMLCLKYNSRLDCTENPRGLSRLGFPLHLYFKSSCRESTDQAAPGLISGFSGGEEQSPRARVQSLAAGEPGLGALRSHRILEEPHTCRCRPVPATPSPLRSSPGEAGAQISAPP